MSRGGSDLSVAVAAGRGIISFLSPCVLPLVPAYLGQLTAVAVVGARRGRGDPSAGSRSATPLAYVAGFGAVFTLLGVTATFAGGRPLPRTCPCSARSAGSC